MAFKRFFGILCLTLVGAILFGFVAQGLEKRQIFKAEDFRQFAQSKGLNVDKVPDWVLGKYRRYEHLHSQDWLQTGIAGLGLGFLGWVGLGALRPRRRQDAGSDNSHSGTA